LPANVIAFTVSGHRQKYLRQSLDSWSRARGIDSWHLLFCLEPCRPHFPVAEFTQWVRGAFASTQVQVNDRWLRCAGNTRQAMSMAFASGAAFTVLAEEDVVVSTDVLEYLSWARDIYQADKEVLTVCAHAKQAEGGGSDADVVRSSWFNPVIWGTWADRWRESVAPGWGLLEGSLESWDANLRRQVVTAGKVSIFPVRSRALHIGEVSSQTPGQLAGYFYRQYLSSCFEPARGPQDYREIPFTEDLGLLV
jgi:GNT-I family